MKFKWFIRKPVLIAVLLSRGLTADCAEAVLPSNEASYTALAFHPGLQMAEPMEQPLRLVIDDQGNLINFYTDVDSVICGDGQCEIITVRLNWDPLGEFIDYEFPKGGNLTKRGHKEFSEADHQKLLGILKAKDSLLAGVDPKDVVHPGETQEGDEIDGTSGATLLSDKSAFVEGALYTCYTLWHWANNDLQTDMRDIASGKMQQAQLLIYLTSGDDVKATFATEQLRKRGLSDAVSIAAIFKNTSEGSTALAAAGLEYYEFMGPAIYYDALGKLFGAATSGKQVLYLTSMVSTDLQAPAGFYDRLSESLPDLGSYYEVHLLLNLMADRNPGSSRVVTNVIALLDHKSFLISRRAYCFLKDLQLSDPQIAEVEAFRNKYADRL